MNVETELLLAILLIKKKKNVEIHQEDSDVIISILTENYTQTNKDRNQNKLKNNNRYRLIKHFCYCAAFCGETSHTHNVSSASNQWLWPSCVRPSVRVYVFPMAALPSGSV
ncbi:Hypothetical protein CINCED_3A019096 [Cinara cedri]|uniref:Uncharacterized protein n=1 Tax=Cinara cedri TaxID=506608 RepID=A0A5E4MRZ5_9HEMI|nr:Hypothetical protein CINCED_3A019096 [Cinara cedri]